MVGRSAHDAPSESLPFWEAAANGSLLLKHCSACARAFHYPRSICPLCGSPETEWRQASGRGVIYACSVARRADPPYCIAYVALDEGPIMLTNIVNAGLDTIRIGQRVKVVFVRGADGKALPMFAPEDGAGPDAAITLCGTALV